MKITKCRLCSGGLSNIAVSLPPTPLANEYLSEPSPQETFPLEIIRCMNCGHFQLSESVNSERLFTNYLFNSGHSQSNIEHFEKYAENLSKHLSPGDLVVDIASNDGTLLKAFKKLGFRVLGVDPAKNLAEAANRDGIETIPEFFTPELADQIIEKYGHPKLVTANNVIAHTDTVPQIIDGVKKLIGTDGIFTFEVSYFLDVLIRCLFDTIYHEHLHYYLNIPLYILFESKGLSYYHVDRIDTHGGSIRGFVSGRSRTMSQELAELMSREYRFSAHYFNFFAKGMDILKKKVKDRLLELKAEGKSIAIYGVPAKSTTLMYMFGIDRSLIDFAIDDSYLKQGKYTPGTHLPIYDDSAIEKYQPDVLLVLAWNFSDSIIKNHPNFKGKWIIPLPCYKEI